jgi:hypothetical protein
MEILCIIKMYPKEMGCVKLWARFSWLRVDPLVGSCEHDDENLSSVKVGNFLTS